MKKFWEERYKNKTMPWDIGQAAPAFVKYFALGRHCKSNHHASLAMTNKTNFAVLGCGRGHDAFYIASGVAQPRLQVYGFDFAEEAIKYCKKIKQKEKLTNIDFYQVDFFELLKDKKWKNYFDYVIEHTSLAAINPKRRKEYANLIKYLLRPDGKLVGLFFIRPKELGGPPYGIEVHGVRELLKGDFIEVEKLHYEECLHKGILKGDEYFGVFEKI